MDDASVMATCSRITRMCRRLLHEGMAEMELMSAPDASDAPLVFDAEAPELRRFRATWALPDLSDLVTHGLSQLRVSASAQLSAAGFATLKRMLEPYAPFYVLDLRQESHGFLNGAAVSWYARNNWGAVGLSPADAEGLERLRLQLLQRAERVEVAQIREIKQGLPPVYVSVEPLLVQREEQVLGLEPGYYRRFPVSDHARPTDEVVETFVQWLDQVESHAWIHLHCRGGKGRTTTFCVLLDLLRNGSAVSLDAILDRQQRIHGYELRKVPEENQAKRPTILERLAFVRDFACFAQARRPGTGWLEYLRAKQ